VSTSRVALDSSFKRVTSLPYCIKAFLPALSMLARRVFVSTASDSTCTTPAVSSGISLAFAVATCAALSSYACVVFATGGRSCTSLRLACRVIAQAVRQSSLVTTGGSNGECHCGDNKTEISVKPFPSTIDHAKQTGIQASGSETFPVCCLFRGEQTEISVKPFPSAIFLVCLRCLLQLAGVVAQACDWCAE